MPSTLIHLGVQGFASRTLIRDIDLRFVYLACVIPDIPWILQRAIHAIPINVDRAELMLRSGVQSSMFYCLILCMAFALVCRRSASVFAILASGCLFHLLLDITQIKWGRGAIFMAPFDWRTTSWDWLWPEHPLFHFLAFASLGFVLLSWHTIEHRHVLLPWNRLRYLSAAALAAIYALSPGLFSSHLFEQDVYFARTLAEQETRAGRTVAFDRAAQRVGADETVLVELFTGELVRIEGIPRQVDKLISARGRFNDSGIIEVQDHHFHPAHTRITASLVGLLLVCLIWGQSVIHWWRRRG